MRGRKKNTTKNRLATAKVTADVKNTEWIFGKVKDDAHLTDSLLLIDNFWNRPVAQGLGVKGLYSTIAITCAKVLR